MLTDIEVSIIYNWLKDEHRWLTERINEDEKSNSISIWCIDYKWMITYGPANRKFSFKSNHESNQGIVVLRVQCRLPSSSSSYHLLLCSSVRAQQRVRFPLPELTARVDGFQKMHPSSRAVNSARKLGPWTRVVETDLKTLKPLNRSIPKFARVIIRPGYLPRCKILFRSDQGFFSPHMIAPAVSEWVSEW